jgi:hypothetical protein
MEAYMTKDQTSTYEKMFDASGVDVGNRHSVGHGAVYELNPRECRDERQRLTLYERGNELTVAIHAELPQHSPVTGKPLDAPEVLLALGAITASVARQNVQVQFGAGERGVKSVVIVAHICRDGSARDDMKERVTTLTETAKRIVDALEEPSFDTRRFLDRVRQHSGQPTQGDRQEQPVVYATFDPAARSELMATARPRKQSR